jgi:hypothetical protein
MLNRTKYPRFRRRAAVAALVVLSGTVLVGFTALSVDMGVLYGARAEAQRAADAGALAGAWALMNEGRLKGATSMTAVVNSTRQNASSTAGLNKVFGSNPTVDQNTANSATGDVVLGRLNNPSNLSEQLNPQADSGSYNAVKVTVRRDSTRNGAIPFFFGQIFGLTSKDVTASAIAAASDNVIGYKTPPNNGNVMMLPIAVDVNSWQALLAGTLSYSLNDGDGWTYNSTTRAVTAGADNIKELNIWPGGAQNQDNSQAGGGQLKLVPGNWGTVKIGVDNNSTSTLGAQIQSGITPDQMARYPNSQLTLDSSGKLYLGGNPGMSNGIKDDFTAIIGQTRTIPLYSEVTGNGNNTTYTIVGFAGVRIMAVQLTGNPGSRYVLAQPGVAADATVVTGGVTGTSFGAYGKPRLVR